VTTDISFGEPATTERGRRDAPTPGTTIERNGYIILEYYARRVAFFFFAAFANASVAGKLTTRRFQRT